MNITEQNNVGETVATNYKAASVFKEFGIDFCCGGNRTIKDVCENKNIKLDELLAKLNAAITAGKDPNIDYTSWPLDLLADYIEKKHHRYVESQVPVLKQYLNKICKVHGDRHPELLEINELFTASAGELTMHMKKEELVLFPYIRKTVEASSRGTAVELPHFGTVKNPIQAMMNEHENEGERFRLIAEITNQYTPPVDACNTYRVAFSLLEEFQNDLHLHIHLENNILFPGIIALENKLANQ